MMFAYWIAEKIAIEPAVTGCFAAAAGCVIVQARGGDFPAGISAS